jgi:uncharacterized LabA/DUF88 family protein
MKMAADILLHCALNTLDIAVVVTGDGSFVPVLKNARMLSKRIVICTLKNSCENRLLDPNAPIRDFDTIWLDDIMTELITTENKSFEPTPIPMEIDNEILQLIIKVNPSTNFFSPFLL